MDITPAQLRAAYQARGLDPDHTLSVSLTPTYAHIETARVDEHGHPIVIGGVLQRDETGIQIDQEAPDVDA